MAVVAWGLCHLVIQSLPLGDGVQLLPGQVLLLALLLRGVDLFKIDFRIESVRWILGFKIWVGVHLLQVLLLAWYFGCLNSYWAGHTQRWTQAWWFHWLLDKLYIITVLGSPFARAWGQIQDAWRSRWTWSGLKSQELLLKDRVLSPLYSSRVLNCVVLHQVLFLLEEVYLLCILFFICFPNPGLVILVVIVRAFQLLGI